MDDLSVALNNSGIGGNLGDAFSIVLDVTKEELSPFNKYLLKHLSFSNAGSI